MKRKDIVKGLLTICMMLPLVGCSSKALEPKDDFTIEYGTPISTNAEDYLIFDEDMKDEDKADILNNTKVEIISEDIDYSEKENEETEEKEYQDIGTYTVKLTYEDETEEVKVTVADTTAPSFKNFKESLEYTKDCEPKEEELLKNFTAEDLSSVTVTADTSKVDYSKVGEYKATVTAKDKSGNAETKETVIKVVDPTIKLNKTSLSMYVKASEVLTPTIKGKDTKATFKSDSTSVATVSSEGKVTAKKAGTATITATANGVSATCKVTVKKAPSNSTTTTKTITNQTTGKKETVTVVEKKTQEDIIKELNESSKVSLSNEAISLINKERVKRGLNKLTYSSTLGSIAKKRVKEVPNEINNGTPHSGFSKYNNWYNGHTYGECIAYGYASASSAVNGWKNSSAHWNCLMEKDFTQIAIARWNGYWVAVLR